MQADASRVVLITGAAGEAGTALVEALLSASWRIGAADLDAIALGKLARVPGCGQDSALLLPIVVELLVRVT